MYSVPLNISYHSIARKWMADMNTKGKAKDLLYPYKTILVVTNVLYCRCSSCSGIPCFPTLPRAWHSFVERKELCLDVPSIWYTTHHTSTPSPLPPNGHTITYVLHTVCFSVHSNLGPICVILVNKSLWSVCIYKAWPTILPSGQSIKQELLHPRVTLVHSLDSLLSMHIHDPAH